MTAMFIDWWCCACSIVFVVMVLRMAWECRGIGKGK